MKLSVRLGRIENSNSVWVSETKSNSVWVSQLSLGLSLGLCSLGL